jgi:hypothetical protein
MLSRQVALQDALGAVGVSLLRVERRAGHVGNHGVSAAEGVLGVAQDVVLGRGLREPDVAAVAAEVAGLKGRGDVFLDDDGAAGGVDEPGACIVSIERNKMWRGGLPGFILEINSLLKRPRVFSWRGQLMVTTSHCDNISSKSVTRRQPISFSISGLRGW